MLVSAANTQVSETLQDTGGVTWTSAQLIEWMNDATRSLALVRPDASSETTAIVLAAGTKQSLSGAGDLRLIRIIRNMGADGLTPGRAIRLGDIKSMDAINPGWHTDTAAAVVREYMYDEARPREFWVYPPVPASPDVYVEAAKVVLPATVSAGGDTVPVDDIYVPALMEWMLYRAFSRDSEQTPNWVRAARHFSAFFNLLQVKMRADMSVSPKVRELSEKSA